MCALNLASYRVLTTQDCNNLSSITMTKGVHEDKVPHYQRLRRPQVSPLQTTQYPLPNSPKSGSNDEPGQTGTMKNHRHDNS